MRLRVAGAWSRGICVLEIQMPLFTKRHCTLSPARRTVNRMKFTQAQRVSSKSCPSQRPVSPQTARRQAERLHRRWHKTSPSSGIKESSLLKQIGPPRRGACTALVHGDDSSLSDSGGPESGSRGVHAACEHRRMDSGGDFRFRCEYHALVLRALPVPGRELRDDGATP
jgi:hypothetical protein